MSVTHELSDTKILTVNFKGRDAVVSDLTIALHIRDVLNGGAGRPIAFSQPSRRVLGDALNAFIHERLRLVTDGESESGVGLQGNKP